MNKVPRWVFRYVGNKTFDFSSKKRIFCPKMTKFSPKLAFLSIAGSFGALLVGWLLVVAQAVSRKTPIYFMICSKLRACPGLRKARRVLDDWSRQGLEGLEAM